VALDRESLCISARTINLYGITSPFNYRKLKPNRIPIVGISNRNKEVSHNDRQGHLLEQNQAQETPARTYPQETQENKKAIPDGKHPPDP
jgi:hypothetical protein